MMRNLPFNPNVIQFIGICVVPLCIITKFYENGSLIGYLKKNGKLPINQSINMLLGISLGVMHLHKNNIIHRDLAARNILLSSKLDAVVSDFGFARILGSHEEIGQTDSEVGPIRWMAVESLRERLYSKKSDAWSFGVVAYEIFSGGKEPYFNIIQSIAAASVFLDFFLKNLNFNRLF